MAFSKCQNPHSREVAGKILNLNGLRRSRKKAARVFHLESVLCSVSSIAFEIELMGQANVGVWRGNLRFMGLTRVFGKILSSGSRVIPEGKVLAAAGDACVGE